MTTLGQLLANRENAQKSTGPTTEEGKFRAALNRLLHGFRSVNPVVTGESEFQFATFKQQLLSELRPQSIEQAELAEQIAGLMWKRRRLDRMEAALFEQSANQEEGATALLTKFRGELDLLLRYKSDLRRELQQARGEFRLLKNEQKAMEKAIQDSQEERLQIQLEMARMDTEDAVKAKNLTPSEAEMHRMRGEKTVRTHHVADLKQWLTEKMDLHRTIYSLCGLGDLSREEMAAQEGEAEAMEAAVTVT